MNSVFFSSHFPSLKKVFLSVSPTINKALVICDKKFEFHILLKKWKKNKNLDFYFVPSGEKSKSLEALPKHIKKIIFLSKNFDKESLVFISIGGGSLGDLTGFLASIYKRGLPVIHFPSTWLAAIDSAHGGKTALNFQKFKNILGTYHFPKAVFIVNSLLNLNPKKREQEAYGELLKIALIEGGDFYDSLQRSYPVSISKFLKSAIQSKMKIVNSDPFETKSIRKKLNFGHTVGHVLEALYPLKHGEAVLEGLRFSLLWSFKKGFLTKNSFKEIQELFPVKKRNKKISSVLFKIYLKQDKKSKAKSQLDFVFIKNPGSVFIKTVLEKDVMKEVQRQGLV